MFDSPWPKRASAFNLSFSDHSLYLTELECLKYELKLQPYLHKPSDFDFIEAYDVLGRRVFVRE